MANWERLQETQDALKDKARFCLQTGIAPSEYDNLTDAELDAFVTVYNDLHKD